MEQTRWERGRLAFRQWRRSRPFWGGLITVLTGLEFYLTVHQNPLSLSISFGPQGFMAWVLPLVFVLCGLLGWFTPQRVFYGVITLVSAVYSLIGLNLGGFVLGMLLGVVGGGLMVSWTPAEPDQETEDADRPGEPGPQRQPLAPQSIEGTVTPDPSAATSASRPGAGTEAGGTEVLAELWEPAGEERRPDAGRPVAPGTDPATDPAAGPAPGGTDRRRPRGRRLPGRDSTVLLFVVGLGLTGLLAVRPVSAEAATCAPPVGSSTPAPPSPAPPNPTSSSPAPSASPTSTSPRPTAQQATPTATATMSAATATPGAAASTTPATKAAVPAATATIPAPAPTGSATASTPATAPTSSARATASAPAATAPSRASASPSPTGSSSCAPSVSTQAVTATAGTLPAVFGVSALSADTLTMHGLSYDGVVDLPKADGSTVQVLKFSMTSATHTPFRLDAADSSGQQHFTAGSLTVSGHVSVYCTSLSGTILLGLVHLSFTPASPPPLVLPDLTLTQAKLGLVDVTADTLTATGFGVTAG